MSLENLEQQLFSSRKVREFLKHFSATQWTRVIKASVIMGIQELERGQQIQNLSCQDLEDIVGKFEHAKHFVLSNLNFAHFSHISPSLLL